MKELEPSVFLAVFQEMLGGLFWPLLILIVVVAVAFLALLVWERTISARRLIGAQALGLLGGAAALILMVKVSSSGFMDAAGPIDWLLIAAVFVVGAIGATVVFYTIAGWRSVSRRRRQRAAG